MNANIEALILSGEFFNGGAGSSSPPRSPSPSSDKGWHDEELSEEALKYQEKGLDYDSDTARRDALKKQDAQAQLESIGMGPGRTGVKGVIRDRDEAAEIQREKQAKEAEELRSKMEAANLGGKTYLEEEREKAERGEKADDLVMREFDKMRERTDVWGQKREGKFGHLREVGLKGFLGAVENEGPGVWVVVHLYDPSLERCFLIDETLAQLARTYTDTKFLRARAATLGFASLDSSRSLPRRKLSPIRGDDEDDPYADDLDDDEEEEESDNDNYDDDVDLDMLPTMLVYRNGDLVHNWVRVDWEAGEAGLKDFLDKHHILVGSSVTMKTISFTPTRHDPTTVMQCMTADCIIFLYAYLSNILFFW